LTRQGPIAVVTGGSGGVGAQLCAELARRGLGVLALGRDAERLEACRQRDPAHIETLRVDLTRPDERERVVAHCATYGGVRFLVHAAAVIEPVVRAEALREEQWRAALAINVEAPLFLSLQLAPQLAGGRILHVSSGAAHTAVAGCLAYCTTKAALHMIYRVLQLELEARGIRVGSASPGSVDTPMQAVLRGAAEADFPEGARFRALAAQERLISPTRSARFLTWLLLDAADALFCERDWNIQDDTLGSLWDAPT
jgi:NAD(P)-dependent dehydrogenase (short-subunit alcohol dehydrogenase family)